MKRFAAALAALTFVAAAGAAHAQGTTWRIIVPFAPGGGQDVLARVIAPELGRILERTIIVENRAGAGGGVGSAIVAKAAPDGSTLVMAASSHTISAALDRKGTYDPVADFTAVAHVGSGAYLMLASAKVPARNAGEFIAAARAAPGKLNYASAGVGSATHLAMAYFASRAGIEVVHVPYKSTGEALNSIVVGDTQALIVPTLGSQAYVDNPALRILGAVSPARLPALPDVPTVSESGLEGFEFSSWFGLLGPAKMPADVTEKINAAMGEVLALPAVRERIVQQGVTPRPLSAAAFQELLARNNETIRGIVKAANMN